MLRIAVAIVPAALVLVLLATALVSSSPRGLGEPAAPFELPRLTGEGTVSLAEHIGRPVVINFWASWCAPCREEAPLFAASWKRYRDRVDFIGIDVLDGRDEALQFVSELGLEYPQAFDVGGKAMRSYRVTGVPETFFVDPRGRLVGHYVGAFEGPTLERAIRDLLDLDPGRTLRLEGSGSRARIR